MKRRLFLVLALVAASPAAAREPPYLTARDLDLVSILPPPVAKDSAADREEQALVLATQQAAGPERIAQAQRDVDESLDAMFGAVLGKPIAVGSLPATTRLLSRIGETEDAVVGPAKRAFGRVRPYLSNSQIKPLVRPSITGSYPSGHTTHVNLVAIALGNIVPEKRAEIWERATDYALSRVIGGMHYFDDLEGGRRAGTAIAVALLGRPEFKSDFDAARRELRAYLGLPP
ncbi:MAG: phosphatase PAP2 family protein [Rhodospirillales bacterium]|nr:phosphatase PAP2 family protein [Rhodospirillales bacterium]